MYNRYVPQPDGSYCRNRVPDQAPKEQHRPSTPRPQPEEHCPPPPPQPIPPCPPPIPEKPCRKEHREQSAQSFLGQLLPKDFDTGDLIVVLLLLLLAGDCEEDRSTALLTLVLYLFM